MGEQCRVEEASMHQRHGLECGQTLMHGQEGGIVHQLQALVGGSSVLVLSGQALYSSIGFLCPNEFENGQIS